MTNPPTPRDLVKVKALRWHRYTLSDEYRAGHYACYRNGSGGWCAIMRLHEYADWVDAPFKTLSAAQAACQAHYEQTIYELLEVR